MPEKLANSATQFPILGPTRRVWMLAALICVAMLMIWSTDQSTVANLIDVWRYPKQYHPQKLENSHAQKHNNTPGSPPIIPNNSKQGHEFMSTHVDSPHVNSVSLPKNENPIKLLQNLSQNVSRQAAQRRNSSGLDLEMHSKNMNQKHNASKLDGSPAKFGPETAPENLIRDHGQVDWDWVQIELEPNYSSNLLARWLAPGGEPCRNAKTAEIKINEGFDDANPVVLSTGTAHVIVFQALDESGTPRCSGGDYFEIEFSGELWKSRPPLKDLGNGSYSFTLQIHPDFAGIYNLSIILLFRHFEGLKYSPTRFVFGKELRRIPIEFFWTKSRLPYLHTCSKSDFNRDVWAGRWTRHARNDSCDISDDGRYRCLQPDYPCSKPWCHGSLGLLESNGWVYSAHCSFKLFAVDEAWKCLNSRWLFLWGDSNHVDTVRNILFFFLGVPQLEVVTRRFDKNFMNPKNESQFVRITNIFNGHWDMKGNYLGLDSLINQEYRDLIKSYFNGSTVPDTVIFNSGLHDGVYWPNIRRFVGGAARAAAFWEEVMKMPEKNGLGMPNFIFRSTVATGGYARLLAFNPSKIEAFNAVLLEKLRAKGIVSEVIDDFDMTWAWHFDNRCNDGVHYGRFPAKLKWKDGRIGHQYFVDLMLGHVLLNAICSR
ncbi:hypothetical protein Nepgr_010233 [Nepenthes gracilis]|uniref:Uncharacterized protein n=1 Tax=Nepenthes gracilis TaxID=150966 RepID=A0AAD3SC45_NEPGR|nr:hypothetical protein Nepgr_010233 [Nepenthes gracilis]